MRFQELLDNAITEWNSGEVDDEWLFQTLREDHVGLLSANEAFLEIPATIGKLLRQRKEMTATEVVETLIALANRSQTTEIPHSLMLVRDSLVDQFDQYSSSSKDALTSLFLYYGL